MATLEDKILGEKSHYYCDSSSDDEANGDDDRGKPTELDLDNQWEPSYASTLLSPSESATNTGPKGVINDWKRYQEMKKQKTVEADLQQLKLMEKMSMSCQSYMQELEEKSKQEKVDEELDKLLEEDDDRFLNEYMKKRMLEMMQEVQSSRNCKKFGELIRLETGEEFLDAIEKEESSVLVIVHISNDNSACTTMNGCLNCLASQYSNIKFCTLNAYAAGMSKRFEKHGVPALLIYKKGHLVGNFVRMGDDFGDDFFATDVETFLIDHGFLPDRELIPELIKNRSIREDIVDESDGDD